MKYKKILLFLLVGCITVATQAQIFPINATTQLVPPYSVYLPDYATGINNQLRVLLLNRDMTQPNYTVKLKMTVELNGSIIMRTSDNFTASPITLQPNEPYSVEGLQLAPYLNSNNIDFIGYSKEDYEQKKGLPEGAYRICFTAYDFNRPDNVKVSNEACSYYYLSKNDPPFINLPACGIYIAPVVSPQENLIEKAGRWLSYTLNIPWTEDEKNNWYTKVVADFTEMFNGEFISTEAKELLLEKGQQYAVEKNVAWIDVYALAWHELVYNEFTKDQVDFWSRELIKYSSETTVINAATGESITGMDMATYMNTGTGNNANISFSWTPRHISSPNTTLSTRYRIELFEVRPTSNNDQLPAMANMAVQSTQPVFTDVTPNTNYQYGPDKPPLTDGLQYAWRVQAFDENGRDWFRNNGYSEVCYFTFGGVPENEVPQMEQLTNFTASAEGERRGRMNWTQSGPYTSYKVRYRKKSGTGNWFDINTDSLLTRVYDLEPNTIYEAQVQGKSGAFYGPFSNLDTFKTPAPLPPPGCGVAINYAAGLSQVPLANATPYMIVKTGKFEFIIDSVGSAGGPGFYKGRGRIMSLPFLAIAQIAAQMAGNDESYGGLKVNFENIFINENREVTQGDVYAVTRPLDEWLDGWDEYYEERRREEQEARNRRTFSNLDSNAVFLPPFNFNISDVLFDSASHTLSIINANGDTIRVVLTPAQIGHDIVVQGLGNNQWVVQPNGVVSLVPNGGLYPGMNRPITAQELDYLKRAITRLKAASDSAFTTDKQLYDQRKEARKQLTDNFYNQNSQVIDNGTETISSGYLGGALVKSTTVSPYTTADNSFKASEHIMNKHSVVKTMHKSLSNTTSLEMLARMLQIQGKNCNQFITESKTAGKNDDYIENEIKAEISNFIEIFLKQNGL